VPVGVVTNLGVWGNHSTTQYPDARNAKIAGLSPFDVIKDHGWLQGQFIETVQKRGAAVIEPGGRPRRPRGQRRARLSQEHLESNALGRLALFGGRQPRRIRDPEGLQFGFPVRTDGRSWEVVTELHHDDDAKDRIRKTTEELIQERDLVKACWPA